MRRRARNHGAATVGTSSPGATPAASSLAGDAPGASIDGFRFDKLVLWLAIGLAVVIFCLIAWPMLFRQVYSYWDLQDLLIPSRFRYSEALRTGDGFLWEPRIYCGTYMFGTGQTSGAHPLQRLLYNGVLPFDVAFNVELLGNYVFLFVGTVLLIRRVGVPYAAAVFGATAFTFGGMLLLSFVHVDQLDTQRSMPWILLLTDIVMCSPRWRRVVLAQLGISFLAASALVGGSSHYFFYTMVAQLGCVLWRWRQPGALRRVILLGLAMALGVAIAAVQLVPSFEGLASMARSHDPLFKLLFALHPANILQLCSPYVFRDRFVSATHDPMEGNTHGMALYCGAFCTVALAWLWMRRDALRERRALIVAVFWFGVGSLVMALGKYGVLYVLVAEMPVLDKFRCSSRYIVLVNLAMAILASIALTNMLKLARTKVKIPWREQWPLMVPLGISAATFVVASWFLLTPHPGHPYAEQLSSIPEAFLGLASISAAVACCVMVARGMPWGVLGIVLLTFAEISIAEIWQHVWKKGEATTIEALVASAPKPPARDGRVLSFKYTNLLTMDGYELLQGYINAPVLRLIPRGLALSMAKDERGMPRLVVPPIAAKVLQLSGVRWIDANQWIELPAPLPRVRLVDDVVVADDEAAALEKIDPARTAIIDHSIGETRGPPGAARITADRRDTVEMDAAAPGPQLMVWAERYDPGWRVAVDGQPVPLLRAYGDFMGWPVGPGRHHVVLRFEPVSFAQGVRITLAALCAALAFTALLFVPVQFAPRRSLAQVLLGI